MADRDIEQVADQMAAAMGTTHERARKAIDEALSSGETFTVQGPPMIWCDDKSGYMVDEEQAKIEGWRIKLLPTGAEVWVKDFPAGPDHEQRQHAISQIYDADGDPTIYLDP